MELKACPFCGKSAIEIAKNSAGEPIYTCSNESCHGRQINALIGAWNIRPLEDALQRKLDIAREALISIYDSDDTCAFDDFINDTLKEIGGVK